MKVEDILRKKGARIVTVRMNETVAIAAQLLRASNISALVVKDVVRTEGNTAAGMFTERDVVRAELPHEDALGRVAQDQRVPVDEPASRLHGARQPGKLCNANDLAAPGEIDLRVSRWRAAQHAAATATRSG